jgi:hypothetical protein
METKADSNDDMPIEIDFSNGVRGKFFKLDAAVHLPVYLEAYLSARAKACGVEVSQIVNELLKNDIELIDAGQ